VYLGVFREAHYWLLDSHEALSSSRIYIKLRRIYIKWSSCNGIWLNTYTNFQKLSMNATEHAISRCFLNFVANPYLPISAWRDNPSSIIARCLWAPPRPPTDLKILAISLSLLLLIVCCRVLSCWVCAYSSAVVSTVLL